MKRIFRYSRHLFRAKGRHGTHSPFVYAFVEEVMRRKVELSVLPQGIFTQKELVLLYKTISYLRPRQILAPQEWLGVLSLITDHTATGLGPLPEEGSGLMPGTLLLLPCRREHLGLLSGRLPEEGMKAIILRPHENKQAVKVWQELCILPGIDLSLDYWRLGLLVKDVSFKARQHFRIR